MADRKYPHLHRLEAQFNYLCDIGKTGIFATYMIPRKENVIADRLSRMTLHPQHEQRLPVQAFQLIEKTFGSGQQICSRHAWIPRSQLITRSIWNWPRDICGSPVYGRGFYFLYRVILFPMMLETGWQRPMDMVGHHALDDHHSNALLWCGMWV